MKSVPNTLTVSRGSSELFSSPQNDEFFKFLKMSYFIISKNSLRDTMLIAQFADPAFSFQSLKLTVAPPNNLVLRVPCRSPIIPVCGRTYHTV